MKNSVVNDQYLQLQRSIQKLNDNLYNQLQEVEINNVEAIPTLQAPVIPQLEISINTQQYKNNIQELYQLISANNEELQVETSKVLELLNDETLERWFKEALAVNTFYFEKFSKDNSVLEWILMFAAETALRPYLQKIVNQINTQITKSEEVKSCACCGEPARLGIVNKQGKKELICPRCTYTWNVKMIQCAHCGAETQKVLRVDEDDSAEVQACTTCNNYSKIIDTRKLLRVDAPMILDVKYLHLDYIAQEKGFGVEEDQGTTH